jgi:hypothetical protein
MLSSIATSETASVSTATSGKAPVSKKFNGSEGDPATSGKAPVSEAGNPGNQSFGLNRPPGKSLAWVPKIKPERDAAPAGGVLRSSTQEGLPGSAEENPFLAGHPPSQTKVARAQGTPDAPPKAGTGSRNNGKSKRPPQKGGKGKSGPTSNHAGQGEGTGKEGQKGGRGGGQKQIDQSTVDELQRLQGIIDGLKAKIKDAKGASAELKEQVKVVKLNEELVLAESSLEKVSLGVSTESDLRTLQALRAKRDLVEFERSVVSIAPVVTNILGVDTCTLPSADAADLDVIRASMWGGCCTSGETDARLKGVKSFFIARLPEELWGRYSVPAHLADPTMLGKKLMAFQVAYNSGCNWKNPYDSVHEVQLVAVPIARISSGYDCRPWRERGDISRDTDVIVLQPMMRMLVGTPGGVVHRHFPCAFDLQTSWGRTHSESWFGRVLECSLRLQGTAKPEDFIQKMWFKRLRLGLVPNVAVDSGNLGPYLMYEPLFVSAYLVNELWSRRTILTPKLRSDMSVERVIRFASEDNESNARLEVRLQTERSVLNDTASFVVGLISNDMSTSLAQLN